MRGRVLLAGTAEGSALVLAEPLSVWGGLDPETGLITDRHHPQHGRCVSGRVLVMPGGRGSSSSSTTLAEAVRLKMAPAAIIMGQPTTSSSSVRSWQPSSTAARCRSSCSTQPSTPRSSPRERSASPATAPSQSLLPPTQPERRPASVLRAAVARSFSRGRPRPPASGVRASAAPPWRRARRARGLVLPEWT